MNSCEEHPLRQTNDLRQFPKDMIKYKHLLAVMMIQSRTIVNAFMSSAKLLTSTECKPTFSLGAEVLKTLQQLMCIIWWAIFPVLDHIAQKEKTSDWWTTRIGARSELLCGWNYLETESESSNSQVCERPFLVLWAVWTDETDWWQLLGEVLLSHLWVQSQISASK